MFKKQQGNIIATIFANYFKSEDNIMIEQNQENIDKHKLTHEIVDEILKNHADLMVQVENKVKSIDDLNSIIDERVNVRSLSPELRTELISAIHNRLFDYERIQSLIEDDEISDVDFIKYNYGTYKRNGVKNFLEPKYLFSSEEEFTLAAKQWITRLDGIINENYAHERVSDERYKLRLNLSIVPRNFKNTSLIIRKHRDVPYTMDDLIDLKMFSKEDKELLVSIVKDKKNFLLCGKGAAGKTTLLRAMMKNVNPLDSYLVCEKDAELYFNEPNFIQQRIKKLGRGGLPVTLNDLIKDGLTMSLEGYIIGEIAEEEAWSVINAGVTDHTVSGTVHANSTEEVPERLLSLVKTFNPDMESETVKKLIARSFDYFIHLKEFKITSISKVGRYDHINDVIEIKQVKGA